MKGKPWYSGGVTKAGVCRAQKAHSLTMFGEVALGAAQRQHTRMYPEGRLAWLDLCVVA